MHNGSAYGLWSLVILNSAIFIFFAFSFAKPKSTRDWRSLGAFSAFVIALFTEMFGFLLQWPTLPTLVMFPILVYVYVYVRLARRKEIMALEKFGDRYREYVARTPAFIPRRKSNADAHQTR